MIVVRKTRLKICDNFSAMSLPTGVMALLEKKGCVEDVQLPWKSLPTE